MQKWVTLLILHVTKSKYRKKNFKIFSFRAYSHEQLTINLVYIFLYLTTRRLPAVQCPASVIILLAQISNRFTKNHVGEKTMEVASDTREMFSLSLKSLEKHQLSGWKTLVNSISLHVFFISPYVSLCFTWCFLCFFEDSLCSS